MPVVYFHLRKRVGIEVLTEMNYWELSVRVRGYERNGVDTETEESAYGMYIVKCTRTEGAGEEKVAPNHFGRRDMEH